MDIKYNTIYVHIPDHYETGGVESLYQLVDCINNLGGNSIALFENVMNNPIPDRYKKYNIKYESIHFFQDRKDDLVIIPEVLTERLINIKNAQRSVWWLSVDNNHGKFTHFNDDTILHFCQSYYAYDYLTKNNTKHVYMLFDYIDYINNNGKHIKNNVICYNPAKGYENTVEIIKANQDLHFIPLFNMTKDVLEQTLKQSKVYIDFGNHPGKDRIPRESVLHYNCLITNKRGSAKYDEDLEINGIYKCEEIEEISSMIRECIYNYDNNIQNFETYRNSILLNKQKMIEQVKALLCMTI